MAGPAWQMLAVGKLQASLTPMIGLDPDESAEIYQIQLVNEDSDQRQGSVYVTKRMVTGEFSDPILFSPHNLLMDAGHRFDLCDNPIQISGGDSFKGICDVADVVHYIIFGVVDKKE